MKIKKLTGEIASAWAIAITALGLSIAALVFGVSNDKKGDHTISPYVVYKEKQVYQLTKPYKHFKIRVVRHPVI